MVIINSSQLIQQVHGRPTTELTEIHVSILIDILHIPHRLHMHNYRIMQSMLINGGTMSGHLATKKQFCEQSIHVCHQSLKCLMFSF